MFIPGYYKINYRAMRVRELVRWYGFQRGFKTYLITRSKQPNAGSWMPGLWTDMQCPQEDLSEEFWLATKPHRLAFEQLGFVACAFLKVTKNLNPLIRDSGAINYLDPTRRHFGQLLFNRVYHRNVGEEVNNIAIAFTAAFAKSSLSCTNNLRAFDAFASHKIIRLASYDAKLIHQKFLEQLQRCKEVPRQFPDDESLRQWSDARQVEAFEDRVRRRLFIPMTDEEVAAAKARLASGDFKSAPPRRIPKLAFALWLTALVAIILLHSPSRRRSHTYLRPDVMEYQGQQFKMRKAYLSYEDYKDDPNNLDTNELDRIEQTMLSVKIQPTYKDRREFMSAMVDLTFPGYGGGGIGEVPQTDDGSTLYVQSMEIPQRDKDRYVVARESDGQITVLDDFVSNSIGNEVRHVKLEKQTLRYYNFGNQLIREKQL